MLDKIKESYGKGQALDIVAGVIQDMIRKNDETNRSADFLSGMGALFNMLLDMMKERRVEYNAFLKSVPEEHRIKLNQDNYPRHERSGHTVEIFQWIDGIIDNTNFINDPDELEIQAGYDYAKDNIKHCLEVGIKTSKETMEMGPMDRTKKN